MAIIHGLNPRLWKGDLYGGLTAAVVALPLALAFGVASGAGAISGLYGAIAVGFFAALSGGTPSQVSGPTGPMTVVMGAIVASHSGNLAEAFTIVMLGGAIQIGFGALRLGRFIAYTPYTVISGFMTGIGVIIIVIQALPFFGLPIAEVGPLETIRALPGVPASMKTDALALAALALAIVIFWPKRLRAALPPTLAALVIGTLAGIFVFTEASVIGDIPTGLPALIVPTLSLENLPNVVQGAFILALLGSIDTLLTSLVADSITRARHLSDRELIGQGIGNVISGLIGGLPGAGATMRTVVNVRSGGRTPLSGALHAVILAALVLGLGPLAERVPHAVLAGILVKVGWDIIDWGYLKRVHRTPLDSAVVMLVTLVLTVFVDLITAVAVGIIIASFVSARWLASEQVKGIRHLGDEDETEALTKAERKRMRQAAGKMIVIQLHGSFSYASAHELVHRVSMPVSGHKAVVFDFGHTGQIDVSAAVAIEELFDQALANSQAIYVSGLQSAALDTLARFKVLDKLPPGRRFEQRADAIDAAVAAIVAAEPDEKAARSALA